MSKYIYLLTISQCFLIAHGQYRDIEIDQGTVRGYKHATRDLYAFHGIPYATAPTGRDKFKSPLPAPKWENNTFLAVDDLVLCPQSMSAEFREDCLIVNVFVPGGDDTDTLKSIVVIVHGGGFLGGYGNQMLPYNIVEKGVVAVTFNYRVGAHGFLCLNTQNIPGNAGLKDQIAALEWIKRNINAFGGNPDDVTVYGASAGAASVELLMLSPTVQDLFHKVILDSASALSTWIVNPKGVEFARDIAIHNGAENVDTLSELENYYLSLSHAKLAALQATRRPSLTFSPCTEDVGISEKWVINELPQNILQSGNYTKLPLLTGYTDAESSVFYGSWDAIMSEMNEKFSSQLPPNFEHYIAIDKEKATELLQTFYFDEDVIGRDSLRNFSDYLTDSYFAYWIIDSARLHSVNSARVYLYEFVYVTSAQQEKWSEIGSAHCTQTELILNEGLLSIPEVLDENDQLVQQYLVDMWTNFIRFGEPVPSGEDISWKPLQLEKMNYLQIDLNCKNKTFPLHHRIQFWDEIVKGKGVPDSAYNMHFQYWLLLIIYVLLSK
ncbi:Esterase FE4 [Eumeta japonica]|uniref:Carboxylic ester hydrolase n=1 Tax=Eumeta variegata TaxID=151549 RepID=A0A4C1V7H3_EUMVA|nr:Esterase FE4 [Eumeta japonica]